MFFYRKIYWHNKPIFLTNSREQLQLQLPITQGFLQLQGTFNRNFTQALQHLNKPMALGVVITDFHPESLIAAVENRFTPVLAAGGIVYNESGDVLMIYRRGRWDLPKGKLDEGEDLATCAEREVKEETGLRQLKVQEKIGETFHLYTERGKELMKCTTWYAMQASDKQNLTPQLEENIQEVGWVPREELNQRLNKSYQAIREILEKSGCLSRV